MNYLNHFDGGNVVEACVAGAGDFGLGVIKQSFLMEALSVRVVIDIDAQRARTALERAGVDKTRIQECSDLDSACRAWDNGDYIATGNHDAVLGLPFDILVEATGIPEAGARHAYAAIMAGKHVGIATKETESVIGPWLNHLALKQDLVFTPLDGDQPSLLIGLITWAQTLGFKIISAGKSSEYDFVHQRGSDNLFCNRVAHDVPGIDACWTLNPEDIVATLTARAEVTRAIAPISIPDLCEMTNVANATGLKPDRPSLHAPILRIPEVPTVLDTREHGGVLSAPGRLEVFNCLRLDDELSFAGGVFVVVRCEDTDSWTLLRDKGHVLSHSGQSAMLYLPRHLLGLEAPISLLDAVRHKKGSGGGKATTPHIDLVACATRDLEVGHRFEMTGHHRVIDGLRAEMLPAKPIDRGGPAPFYLLPGTALNRAVTAGEPIPFDALDHVADTTLLQLRREQDAHFFNP